MAAKHARKNADAVSDGPQSDAPIPRDARKAARKVAELRTQLPVGIVSLIDEKVGDGNLSEDDLKSIMSAVRSMETENPLASEDFQAIADYARYRTAEAAHSVKGTIPTILKVLGVLCIFFGSAFLIYSVILLIIVFNTYATSADELSATYKVVSFVSLAIVVVFTASSVVLGIRLLRNKRRGAAVMFHIMSFAIAGTIVCDIMLHGVNFQLAVDAGIFALVTALSSYLDPSLQRERDLSRELQNLDTERRAKSGTLGLSLHGQGYITLDFFNLFWIFIIGCVVGLIGENIFHVTVITPGVFQDRTGVLYGPFSPVYGFGAVLMTIALNRFRNANPLIIFVACTIIGGAFEYFVSLFMEVSFGGDAWNYSDQFLNIGGRTCLLYASMFGVAGLIWIKALLPVVLTLINKIPWQWRYSVTTVCAVLMCVNCVMTLGALDCWYERCCGKEPVTPLEEFYERTYGDEFMESHFQSMVIRPADSARGADGQ